MSTRNPAIRRILKEVSELQQATSSYAAYPLEDNLFEWHFTIAGPPGTSFEGGAYHGRILLPNEYPFKPPWIILLTPNGRFEVGKKICLSITGFHPEYWQPAWGVRTVLMAIISFMPTRGEGAIGALDYTDNERQVLAKASVDWKCEVCGKCNKDLLCKEVPADVNVLELPSELSFGYEPPKSSPAEALDEKMSEGPASDGGGSVSLSRHESPIAAKNIALSPDTSATAPNAQIQQQEELNVSPFAWAFELAIALFVAAIAYFWLA